VLPPLELSESRNKGKSPADALIKAVEALAIGVQQLSIKLEDGIHVKPKREDSLAKMRRRKAWSSGRTVEDEEQGEDDCKEQLSAEKILKAIQELVDNTEKRHEVPSQETVAISMLAEELASQRAAMKELVQAIQGFRCPLPSPSRPPVRCESRKLPRYRPHLSDDGRISEFPEVELSVKIYQVSNVNTSDMTFDADFVCRLDWCDPHVQGVATEELAGLDWTIFFNPVLYVDNSKDGASWMEGIDLVPRRKRPASEPSTKRRGDQLQLGPWLRKTMRFRGALTMGAVDLRCFPFDLQALPIRLRAGRCQGLTLGTPAAGAVARDEVAGRVNLLDNGSMLSDERYKLLDARIRGRGHYAVPQAAEALQEFNIKGITGHHHEKNRGDAYEVCIVIERPKISSYFWDIIIQNLLVMLAATAFWDTASADLSSKMSITLVVILTLAAYTSSRPSPIEKAPYVTLHDWNEQTSMMVTTVISLQNVLSVVRCGGEKPDAPSFMKEEFERNADECAVGWCHARNRDCVGLLFTAGLWLLLMLYSSIWLLRTRRRATQALARQLLSVAAAQEEHEAALERGRSGFRSRFMGKLLRCCSRRKPAERSTSFTHVEVTGPGYACEPAGLLNGSGKLQAIAEVPQGCEGGESAGNSDTSPVSDSSPKRPRPKPVDVSDPPPPGTLPSATASPGAAEPMSSPGSRGRANSRPSRPSGTSAFHSDSSMQQRDTVPGRPRFGAIAIVTPSPSPSPTFSSNNAGMDVSNRISRSSCGLTLASSTGRIAFQPFLPS